MMRGSVSGMANLRLKPVLAVPDLHLGHGRFLNPLLISLCVEKLMLGTAPRKLHLSVDALDAKLQTSFSLLDMPQDAEPHRDRGSAHYPSPLSQVHDDIPR